MDDCAPSIFLRNWVLVVMYLCFRFHIFNRPILEEYVFQIEEGKRGGGHIYFNHVYMQHEMTFLLKLGRCTLFLKVW
jgi:hypothetical protein